MRESAAETGTRQVGFSGGPDIVSRVWSGKPDQKADQNQENEKHPDGFPLMVAVALVVVLSALVDYCH